MTSRIVRIRSGIREALLWCGAVLGVICLLAALASAVFDVKPLIFRSGSMAPSIETGALGLAREVGAEEVEVGDIVSVVNAESVRVTHRVIEVEDAAEGVVLHLQGDANTTRDAETYPVSSVDRVFASVPYAGYAVAWVSGPVGIFAGGVLVGVLLLVAFGPGTRRRDPGASRPTEPERRGPELAEPGTAESEAAQPGAAEPAGGGPEATESKPEPGEAEGSVESAAKGKRGRRAGALVVMVVLALGAQGAHQSQDTMANWTDQATAQSGTFAGQTLAPPPSHACSNEGGLLGLLGYVRITWPHVDPRYEYRLVPVLASNGQPAGNAVTVPNPGAGAQTVVLEVRIGLLNIGIGSSDINLMIYSRLPGTNWESPSFHTVPIRTAQLLVGLSVRCEHN